MFHQLVITLIIIRMHDTKDLGPQKQKLMLIILIITPEISCNIAVCSAGDKDPQAIQYETSLFLQHLSIPRQ